MADNLNENTKLDHRLDEQLGELQIETDVMNFTEFTPAEIKEATDNFHNSLKIGEGGFAIVYKGYLQQTTVAIKIMKSESYQGDLKIEFNQELDILSKLKQRNFVSLIGFSLEARALVYEFLPNGSLDTYLTNDMNSPKKLSWQDRIRIASEICSALIFLHSVGEHGIAHGDLKPQNILLDASFVSKIIDFGISRELEKTDQTLTPLHLTKFPKFSPLYADPEFFSSYELTPQYDIYSYGIILLQLVTGRGPHKIKEFVEEALEMGKLNTIVDSTACWPKEVAEGLALLGLWCSEPSRKKRPDLAREAQPEIESMKRATYKLACMSSWHPSHLRTQWGDVGTAVRGHMMTTREKDPLPTFKYLGKLCMISLLVVMMS